MEGRRMLNLFFCSFALLFVVEAAIDPTAYRSYCQTLWDGESNPKSCIDLLCMGYSENGVYKVYPKGARGSFEVYCDQVTDGGGWTVFQRRMDGSVEFYRNLYAYKLGFGHPNGEFWLGNDRIVSVLGAHSSNELRVDLESVGNDKAYASYSSFSIGNEASGYVLGVAGYSGTAGESMIARSNGHKFAARDHDYDDWAAQNCAVVFHGAWWYSDCHHSNLNGGYLNGTHSSYANGVNWHSWKGYYESLKTSEMKFRGVLSA